MSEVKVNKISPRSGTTVTLGDSGDTIAITSGASFTGFTSTGIDDNATSTAVTINSSGSLLIGTSDTNVANNTVSGDDGININPNNIRTATTDGAGFQINRINSDGSFIEFYKEGGSALGSIGTTSGNLIFDGGSGNTGLRVANDSIIPRDNGSDANGTVDLGANGIRFNNVFLNGNVVVANGGGINFSATTPDGTSVDSELLDDYEEGTWTPVYTTSGTDFTSVTYDFRRAHYTKIGRQVTCTLSMRTDAITKGSASGNVLLDGLPFQVDVDTYEAVALGSDFAVNNPSGIRINDNTTTANLQKDYDNTNLSVSDMGTGTDDNLISLVFTYFTD